VRRIAMDENKLEILKMVESGKITADEGAKLLRAIDPKESKHKIKATVICLSGDEDPHSHLHKMISKCCGEEGMKVIQCCDDDESEDTQCCGEPE
jgi:hypothetical protein